jgi:hypothetical protein
MSVEMDDESEGERALSEQIRAARNYRRSGLYNSAIS